MARIKIDIPDKFIFTTEIPIMVNNINRGNHLSYDSLLPMMEETRVRFMSSIGFPREEMEGAGFIVADVAVVYKKQGRHGQILKFELAVTDMSKNGCDFIFRISDAETGDEIARSKMGIVFFNYAQQKVVPVPGEFRKRYGN